MLLPLLPLLLASIPADAAPSEADKAAVMAPVNALFDGIAKRDPATILGAIRADGSAAAVRENPDGTGNVRRMTAAALAAGIGPGPEKLEERLTNPTIQIDGDIAMVWGNYIFLIDGKVHHCGVDHFDLVRANGVWKVLNITWTARTTGCPTQ